jgi:hypothetical protein
MKTIFCIGFILLLVCMEAAAAVPGPNRGNVSLQHVLDRDYGYFIGDLVRISYRIALPTDRFLDPVSFSKERIEPGGGFAVRGSTIREAIRNKKRTYEVSIVYQVFSSSKSVRIIETPALPFHYGPKGNTAAYATALPPVPITVSPLTAAGAQLQPPILSAAHNSSSKILLAIGTAIMLLSALLLAFAMRRPFRGPSPFSTALKGLKAESDPEAALARFRTALNTKAGRVVFNNNVNDFFGAFPAARPLREEIRDLIALSDEVSFNPRTSVRTGEVIERVSRVVKRLRRMERWM